MSCLVHRANATLVQLLTHCSCSVWCKYSYSWRWFSSQNCRNNKNWPRQERLNVGIGGSCSSYWGIAHPIQREYKLQIIAGWKECHFDCAAFSYFQLAVWHPGSMILGQEDLSSCPQLTLCSQGWLCTQSLPALACRAAPLHLLTQQQQAGIKLFVLFLYSIYKIQDNVSSSSPEQKKMAKAAELSITAQARPAQLHSPRDMGNSWIQTAKALSSTTKKSNQGLLDKYCIDLLAVVDMLEFWHFLPDVQLRILGIFWQMVYFIFIHKLISVRYQDHV